MRDAAATRRSGGPVTRAFERAFVRAVQRLAKERRTATARVQAEASRSTRAVMRAFAKRHPDWQTYETAMVDLGQHYGTLPSGMTELAFLERLYRLAKFQLRLRRSGRSASGSGRRARSRRARTRTRR